MLLLVCALWALSSSTSPCPLFLTLHIFKHRTGSHEKKWRIQWIWLLSDNRIGLGRAVLAHPVPVRLGRGFFSWVRGRVWAVNYSVQLPLGMLTLSSFCTQTHTCRAIAGTHVYVFKEFDAGLREEQRHLDQYWVAACFVLMCYLFVPNSMWNTTDVHNGMMKKGRAAWFQLTRVSRTALSLSDASLNYHPGLQTHAVGIKTWQSWVTGIFITWRSGKSRPASTLLSGQSELMTSDVSGVTWNWRPSGL